MNYFVTAIGTDSGKTLLSAILCEMGGFDYWKPIQAGFPRDTEAVQALVSNLACRFLPEQFVLNTPASPHYAAEVDGAQLRASDLRLPATSGLLIEGAGGLLVPINDEETIADIIPHCHAEVVLVANLYLGSINHTLLTVQELKRRNLPVKGIIFNGEPNPASEDIILKISGYRCLLRVPKLEVVNKETVQHYAALLRKNW